MTAFELFDTLPSTQTLALERLRDGRSGPGWVLAKSQSNGVGRLGKPWQSPSGNFMASRYEVTKIETRAVSQLSFVTALALYEMLWPLVSQAEGALKIKWPNDLLYEGRKLCGILIQTEPVSRPGHVGVVIGVGINVATAPRVEEYETVALNDILLSDPMDPEALLHKLDKHLEAVFTLWREKGFDHIRRAWLKRAYGRDTRLSVISDGLPVSGVLKELNDYGALVVQGDDGQEYTVTGGKISYGASDAAGD